jgi:SAM-dependent methyltransferase
MLPSYLRARAAGIIHAPLPCRIQSHSIFGNQLGKVYKRYAPAAPEGSREVLGLVGGSGDLEADIRLCSRQTIEPLFRMFLPREGKILEAGAGRGRWVFYLRRLGYDVAGLDLSRAEIAAARAFDPDVPIEYGNVLRTGYPDRSFAAVISLGVLEHFESGPQPALAEVRRILRSGGVFLVTVPTQNVMRVLLFNRIKGAQNLYRRIRNVRLEFDEYRYSRGQFETLLREAGFHILERAPDDFLPPMNMGLYADSRFLVHPERRWELNRAGNVLNAVLSAVSPWLHCSGTLWVCRSD